MPKTKSENENCSKIIINQKEICILSMHFHQMMQMFFFSLFELTFFLVNFSYRMFAPK